MRRTCRMGATVALLIGISLVGFGCQPPYLQAVKVPKGFDFSTTKDVTVKVTVADDQGNVIPEADVVVAATADAIAADDVMVKGTTDSQGNFEYVVSVPARFDSLRVQASVAGGAEGIDAAIVDNEVSVSFGPES